MTNLLVLLPAAGDYRSRSAGNTCIQWRGQISNAAWGSNLNGRFQHFMRNALDYAGKGQLQVVLALINTVFAQDSAEAAEAQWAIVSDQL